MKKLLRTIVVGILLYGMTGCNSEKSAETRDGQRKGRVPVAATNDALKQIKSLADQGLHEKLGFGDTDEASGAQLGEALPVYFVGLRQMRRYTAETDDRTFLGEPLEMVYPVMAGDSVRSSVSMQKDGEGWQIASMGRPNRARGLAQLRALHDDSGEHGADSQYFLVEIPSLYLLFLGHREGDVLKLIPTSDDEDLGFVRGSEMDGAEVLTIVQKFAMETDGALSARKP